MTIFHYSYMIRALIVGILISILLPCIGLVVVNKKISVIGDSLSHVALAGIILGVMLGTMPLISSMILCVLASLLLEYIRKKFPGYQDISTAIIMSTGVGLASILTGFVKKSINFEGFLFGSIVTINNFETMIMIVLSIIVFLIFVYLYRKIMYISFDEVGASLAGININKIDVIFMTLIALTISMASKSVGVLIVSSLMIIPVATALQFDASYFRTIVISIVFGMLFTICGLIVSFYLGLKPGGTIVITGVLILLLVITLKNFWKRK